MGHSSDDLEEYEDNYADRRVKHRERRDRRRQSSAQRKSKIPTPNQNASPTVPEASLLSPNPIQMNPQVALPDYPPIVAESTLNTHSKGAVETISPSAIFTKDATNLEFQQHKSVNEMNPQVAPPDYPQIVVESQLLEQWPPLNAHSKGGADMPASAPAMPTRESTNPQFDKRKSPNPKRYSAFDPYDRGVSVAEFKQIRASKMMMPNSIQVVSPANVQPLNRHSRQASASFSVQQKDQRQPSKPAFLPTDGARKKHQDDFCLFFLFILSVAFGTASYYSYITGDFNRLIYSTDSMGNLCGNGEMSKKPYLLPLNLTNKASYSICVDKCNTGLYILDNTIVTTCPAKKQQNNTKCSFDKIRANVSTPLRPIFNKCVPIDLLNAGLVSQSYTFLNDTDDLNSTSVQTSNSQSGIVTDLLSIGSATSWFTVYANLDVIGMCAAASMLMSIIWFYFLQTFGRYMIYTTFSLCILVSGGSTGILIFFYIFRDTLIKELQAINVFDQFQEYYSTLLMILIIVMGLCFLGLTVYIIIYRKSVQIASAALSETSSAFSQIPYALFLPFWMTVLSWVAAGMVGSVLVYHKTNGNTEMGSILSEYGTIKFNISGPVYTGSTVLSPYLYIIQYGSLVWLVWFVFWLLAVSHSTIAGVIAQWYFRTNKSARDTRFYVFPILKRVLRYNAGTLAFSCIIRPVVMVVQILDWFVSSSFGKVNRVEINETKFDKFRNKVAEYIRISNRNVHITVSIYSKSFFESGRIADKLITAEMKSLAGFQTVSKTIIALGQMSITVVTVIIGVTICYNIRPYENAFANNTIVLIIIGILGYISVLQFLGIYVVAIDTLFICFCEDMARNSGKADQPYYMSDRMRKLMSVSEIVELK